MTSYRNELLSALPASELGDLEPQLKRVSLPRGTVLYETGDTIERVYFPESGLVSLVLDLTGGEIIETALIGFDGAVGGFAALHNRPALNKAMVQIDCTASMIEADALRRLCRPDSALAEGIGLHNLFLHAQAQQSAACNAAHSLEAKLCRWLLRAHDLCGPNFALTQEAMAAFLGVRRTSVSITAHDLQNAGIIRYRRGIIEILDLDRLRQGACECYAALRAQKARLRPDQLARGTTSGAAG